MTAEATVSGLIYASGPVRVYAAPLPPGGDKAQIVRRLLAADPAVPPGFAVEHTAEGAPYLAAEGHTAELPQISVTHSRSLVAVAVAPAGCAVGVDAETVGRDRQLLRVARRFLSAEQLRDRGEDPAQLLIAWTYKEALYKAALTPGLPLEELPLPESDPGMVAFGGRRFATRSIPSPDPDNVISLAYLADFSVND